MILFLFLSGGIAAAAILFLRKYAVHPRISDGPRTIDVTPLSVTPVSPTGVRSLSWPNSGFRNIGRGTKGG